MPPSTKSIPTSRVFLQSGSDDSLKNRCRSAISFARAHQSPNPESDGPPARHSVEVGEEVRMGGDIASRHRVRFLRMAASRARVENRPTVAQHRPTITQQIDQPCMLDASLTDDDGGGERIMACDSLNGYRITVNRKKICGYPLPFHESSLPLQPPKR